MRAALVVVWLMAPVGCALATTQQPDAGQDAGAEDGGDRRDAGVDAAAAPDADVRDASVSDAPIEDAAWVPFDAGPCVPGEYRLEGTPVDTPPPMLGYASSAGWRELVGPADGVLHVLHIEDDLDTITVGEAVADTPLVLGGVAYEARPTRAFAGAPIDETLVAFLPVGARDHVLVARYGLDGARRGPFSRIDVPGVTVVHASWTGSGYSMLLLDDGSTSAWTWIATRVELDAAGPTVAGAALLHGGLLARATYDPATRLWHGIGAFETASWLEEIAPDGASRETGLAAAGALGWTFLDDAYDVATHEVWALATSVVLETDLTLYELRDDASVVSATPTTTVTLDPTTRAAIAIEGGHTAAALVREGGEHWFVRVRDGVVVQRLSLPRAPVGALMLRSLGDRYAVGWGGMLDELVLCP